MTNHNGVSSTSRNYGCKRPDKTLGRTRPRLHDIDIVPVDDGENGDDETSAAVMEAIRQTRDQTAS